MTDIRVRKGWRFWIKGAAFPLLMGVGLAMLGNVIGYGFSHDSVQLIVVGFTGGIAILIAFWISLIR